MFSVQSTSRGVWADSAALVKMQHYTFLPLPEVQSVTHSRGNLGLIPDCLLSLLMTVNSHYNRFIFLSNLPLYSICSLKKSAKGDTINGSTLLSMFSSSFNSVSQQKSRQILLKWHPYAKPYSTAFCYCLSANTWSNTMPIHKNNAFN